MRAARAQTPEWHYDRVRPIEITLTANAYVATLALGIYASSPAEPRWRGGILLDEPARELLRLRSRPAREVAARVSDVLLFGALAYPVVVDSLLVAGVVHGDADLAAQMALTTAESFAAMRMLNDLTKLLVGRQRPYDRECRRYASYSSGCGGATRYQSFVSGHSLASFTAAFLTCAHHAHLPLYGAPWDALACGGTLAAAATTGVLRILSDNHYLSDVLAGAALGAVAGLLLPWALHYRGDEPAGVGRASAAARQPPPRTWALPPVTLPLP